MRWCSYHKALHPLAAFSKAAKSADQLSWWCRDGQRAYRDTRREQYQARDRANWPQRAAKASLKLALKRKSRKTYHSKHNPLALRPEQRQLAT